MKLVYVTYKRKDREQIAKLRKSKSKNKEIVCKKGNSYKVLRIEITDLLLGEVTITVNKQ